MGCGSSTRTKVVTPDQAQEISFRLQKQAEQILQLEKAQLELMTQVSVLQRTSHSSNGWLRATSVGSPREAPAAPLAALADGDTRGGGLLDEKGGKGFLQILPALQHYEWGKPWETSYVARLAELLPDYKLNRGLNYAEMWMGTHPNGPARVWLEGLDGVGHSLAGMKETIARRPQFWLGHDVQRGDLPFLFKVVSVNVATPIQAHPTKRQAALLHHANPRLFKDDNHKNELCLPLGEYEGLVGFRPLEDVRNYVCSIHELNRLVGDNIHGGLKDMYAAVMRADPELARYQIASLVSRLDRSSPDELTPQERLLIRLHDIYPGDVGILSVYFLNYVRIGSHARRRFVYCPAAEPHCHLSGDFVACMSLSDNAVLGALAPPQSKDVGTFLEMLSYQHGQFDSFCGIGEVLNKRLVKYATPAEFMVYEVEGGSRDSSQELVIDLPRAAVCLCTRGLFNVSFTANGPVEEIHIGHSYLLRAGSLLTIIRSEQGSRLFVATYSQH